MPHLQTHSPPAVQGAAAGISRTVARRVQTYDASAEGRARIESYIAEVFRLRYGARVRSFAPVLVGLHDASGDLLAAAGFRAADDGPLFLERYLRRPIEDCLSLAPGRPLSRSAIAEVGHLASDRPGEGRQLILQMAGLLLDNRFEWVVSTLTTELRQIFVRMGVPPLVLGVADPERLGPAAMDWGTYYDHRPLVQAGQLRLARQLIERRSQRP